MKDILDHIIIKNVDIRSNLFRWVESILLLGYSIVLSHLCYLYFIGVDMGGIILLLSIGTNLRFIYVSRKAILAYSNEGKTIYLKQLKNGGLQLISICTSTFLCLCMLAIIMNLLFSETPLSMANTPSPSFIFYLYMGLALFLGILQVVHTILMVHIFNLVFEN